MPKLREKNEYEQLNSKKMIREVTMYRAECDGCKCYIDFPTPFPAWARNIAISNCGWKEINGKLYCLTCQKHNKEKDEYKPKKK